MKHFAEAGSLESCDLLVAVMPSDGVSLEISSSVEKQFGDRIETVVRDVLEDMSISGVFLKIQDRGALDYTVRARVITALKRAMSDEAA